MSKFLNVIGKTTIVVAIILGIIYGVKNDPIEESLGIDSAFRWSGAIIIWFSGVISGSLLIAFGMVLDYLDDSTSFLREIAMNTREKNVPMTESYDQYSKEVLRKFTQD